MSFSRCIFAAWTVLLVLLVSNGVTASPAPDKIYSYICLAKEQKLCFGISTDTAPVYDAANLYRLQLKRRDKNEEKGLDWMKTRWSVYRENGTIQLANFTSLCLARKTNDPTYPEEAVLRPCGSVGSLGIWNLTSMLSNIAEQGTIRLRSRPDQCLTVMKCNRGTTPSTDYCDPTVVDAFVGTTFDPDLLRGTYVKFMPCSKNTAANQLFQQTIDCAPGCSPFMMVGPKNTCDQECANDACKWDNMACATPKPTPPTFSPSGSPTVSPTTSRPSKQPSRSPSATPSVAPSQSPTQTPSRQPTTSRPSRSPTTSPTTSRPSQTPSAAPTRSPSSTPSSSPTTSRPSRNPTFTPSGSPTTSPSRSPSKSPSRVPSRSPTLRPTPNATLAAVVVENTADALLWLWILIGILLALLLLCCVFFAVVAKRKERRKAEEAARAADKEAEVLDFTDSDGPSMVFIARDAPQPLAKQTPTEGERIQIPLVLPLQKPAADTSRPESADFVIQDSAASESLMFPDEPIQLTPRSAAAQASLSPHPLKRPQGGAPSLLWGGNQDDMSESQKQDRSYLRQQSLRLQEGELSQALAGRSFKMPREQVNEGYGKSPSRNPDSDV